MKLSSITRITEIYAVEDAGLRERYSEVIICAPKRELRICCDRDSDEILLSDGVRKKRKDTIQIIKGDFRVEWIWTMTNQQGYSDGVRIQIARANRRHIFDFISIASCIAVFESKEWGIKNVENEK